MNTKDIYYYKNGETLQKRPFLSDECYADAILTSVNPCTDCLIVDRNREVVLLPVRDVTGSAGLWFVGGVWKSRISATENMANCFNRETKLNIAPDRFVPVNIVAKGGQPLQTMWSTGRHDLHFVFSIKLSEEEKLNVSLDEKEYKAQEGLQEFTREQLVKAGARDIIVDCFDAIMMSKV
jgi:hypothetical protein